MITTRSCASASGSTMTSHGARRCRVSTTQRPGTMSGRMPFATESMRRTSSSLKLRSSIRLNKCEAQLEFPLPPWRPPRHLKPASVEKGRSHGFCITPELSARIQIRVCGAAANNSIDRRLQPSEPCGVAPGITVRGERRDLPRRILSRHPFVRPTPVHCRRRLFAQTAATTRAQ